MPNAEVRPPPGTGTHRGWRPSIHYELIGCALHGHALVGVDVAEVTPQDDAHLVRVAGDTRWHRCLRCDAWLPVLPAAPPSRDRMPTREEIDLPLRGRPLRDRYVLRLIALDRALHVIALGLLALGILLFAVHRTELRASFTQLVNAVQGGLGGPLQHTGSGFIGELYKVFSFSEKDLLAAFAVVVAYAVLEAAEMVGLWRARRWAEYLTFVATVLLLPLETYELTHRVSPLKIVTLLINLAIAVYLLLAKRLFGLRGGGARERAERERDLGWDAVTRATPPFAGVPTPYVERG